MDVGVWQAGCVPGKQNKQFFGVKCILERKDCYFSEEEKKNMGVWLMLLIGNFWERINLDRLGWRMTLLDRH